MAIMDSERFNINCSKLADEIIDILDQKISEISDVSVVDRWALSKAIIACLAASFIVSCEESNLNYDINSFVSEISNLLPQYRNAAKKIPKINKGN